jgi:hypothetical protein
MAKSGVRTTAQNRRQSGVESRKSLAAAERFHGHLGPWLILGLKAGAYGSEELAASPFELRARVACPPRTPYTCFIDGIQLSSGCTMGKGNISHRRASGCSVEFIRTEDGLRRTAEFSCQKSAVRSQKCGPSRIRMTVRPEVWDELHRRSGGGMAGAEKLGREFARRPLGELFVVLPTTATPGASN